MEIDFTVDSVNDSTSLLPKVLSFLRKTTGCLRKKWLNFFSIEGAYEEDEELKEDAVDEEEEEE